jgi:hypothetical protein
MQIILALRSFSEGRTTANDYDAAKQELREQHGNDRQILR